MMNDGNRKAKGLGIMIYELLFMIVSFRVNPRLSASICG